MSIPRRKDAAEDQVRTSLYQECDFGHVKWTCSILSSAPEVILIYLQKCIIIIINLLRLHRQRRYPRRIPY